LRRGFLHVASCDDAESTARVLPPTAVGGLKVECSVINNYDHTRGRWPGSEVHRFIHIRYRYLVFPLSHTIYSLLQEYQHQKQQTVSPVSMPHRSIHHVRFCIGFAILALAFINAYVAFQHLKSSDRVYLSMNKTVPTIVRNQQQQQVPRRHRIMFVHIGKTGGETIRNLLPVACQMRQNKKHLRKCAKRFQMNLALNSTPLSQQTIGTIHCHLTIPKDALKKATTLIVSVRNPIDRVISWYRYIHPGNCNRRVDAESAACHAKTEMEGNLKKMDWSRRFFDCFDSLEEMGKSLMPTQTTNCSLLAKRTVLGKASKLSGHMRFNYEYYWNRTMVKHPTLESMVVRTESLWTDIDRIQELLWLESGGDNDFHHDHPRLDHTHGSEGHKRADSISGPSLQWLCCILTREIQIYAEWIRRATNLEDAAKQQTLLDVAKRCGVNDAAIFETPNGWETKFCPISFSSILESAEMSTEV
jgi:uncharacterized protein YoaH (UPF0181 family)